MAIGAGLFYMGNNITTSISTIEERLVTTERESDNKDSENLKHKNKVLRLQLDIC